MLYIFFLTADVVYQIDAAFFLWIQAVNTLRSCTLNFQQFCDHSLIAQEGDSILRSFRIIQIKKKDVKYFAQMFFSEGSLMSEMSQAAKPLDMSIIENEAI